ncbi:MAG: Na+ dependent nucleoside transporter domain protein [Acidobacteria bacterium]|nr:Na+ dependent nucleoside transporter domain protein [Acidobacteriota bacterium]
MILPPRPAPAGPRTSGDWRPRLGLAMLAALLGAGALWLQDVVDPRLRAVAGIVAFLAVAGACSAQLRAVNLRLVLSGLLLQIGLAVLILWVQIAGVRPGYEFFGALAAVATQFLEFTSAGSQFVFGVLADPEQMAELFPDGFVLAFASLPILIFMSAVFMVLYHVGVLQVVVKLMARVMARLMGTSGAESLSAAANVFLGVTEAPLIIRPYIAGMTQSELLALMTGGLATIAGTVMAIYISLGADPVAALTTSVMAAPCGLYLSKILLPETGTPATVGTVQMDVEREHVNVIDALAAGASDGTRLAINVAAMLIAFLAFIAMFDYGLGLINANLSLAAIFGWLFAPVAALLGVSSADLPAVADLLGTKLATNEFVAYIKLNGTYLGSISEHSRMVVTFALTGFANFGSIGILLGGIGGMAPSRRADLARLAPVALLGGFLATLINAAIASVLLY